MTLRFFHAIVYCLVLMAGSAFGGDGVAEIRRELAEKKARLRIVDREIERAGENKNTSKEKEKERLEHEIERLENDAKEARREAREQRPVVGPLPISAVAPVPGPPVPTEGGLCLECMVSARTAGFGNQSEIALAQSQFLQFMEFQRQLESQEQMLAHEEEQMKAELRLVSILSQWRQTPPTTGYLGVRGQLSSMERNPATRPAPLEGAPRWPARSPARP